MLRRITLPFLTLAALLLVSSVPIFAQEAKAPAEPAAEEKKEAQAAPTVAELQKKIAELEGKVGGLDTDIKGDTAWMLVSTAFVMFMVPGLALFYGGMVRRKNILATMMHSMICLAFVGVFWIAIGYCLAFGDPWIKIGGTSILGFSPELIFMRGVAPTDLVPNTHIPVYVHMLFQGMFAIITPALISGALAERIKFKPYLIFVMLWMVLAYCPLAHSVWAMNWNWGYNLITGVGADDDAKAKDKETKQANYLAEVTKGITDEKAKEEKTEYYTKKSGSVMVGYLGSPDTWGALDFAGGTVVHIAAGLSSLAVILVLRRRMGYPEQAFHPSSMVLTLTGAGMLWFGWFGFNGGSGGGSGTLAASAFAATQAAAAAAGLSWIIAEWIHRGKPTALGLASGIVAGLVAVTPASGYVLPWAGLVIGLVAGVVCYISVNLKSVFKYDDSLDAFGVHGVGGFLGAIMTGVFCMASVNSAGGDGYFAGKPEQVVKQFVAAAITAVLAFVVSAILAKVIDLAIGFTSDSEEEIVGLDRTEHGETGFDFGLALESAAANVSEPRAANLPAGDRKRFTVVLDGVNGGELAKSWADLCQPSNNVSPEFKKIYKNVTTVQGNRFQFRGGDQNEMRDSLQKLFQNRLKSNVKANVEV